MLKNFKKIALSLLVVGLAFGVQSFTNAKLDEGDIYVQLTEDNYTLLSGTFDGEACNVTNDSPCAVQVTEEGAANDVELEAPFTDAEIATYTAGLNPYLIIIGGEENLYNPE